MEFYNDISNSIKKENFDIEIALFQDVTNEFHRDIKLNKILN